MQPQEIYNMLFKGAAEIVARGDEPSPMLFAIDGESLTIVHPMGLSKDEIAATHRALAQRYGAAAFVDAAWQHIGNVSPATMKALDEGRLSVRDLPGATTVVMFSIRMGAKSWLATCSVDGKALHKGPLMDAEKMVGRFGNRKPN